jgi:hypothetical protein
MSLEIKWISRCSQAALLRLSLTLTSKAALLTSCNHFSFYSREQKPLVVTFTFVLTSLRNKDGMLDIHEFGALNKKFPMLLYPAFQLQDAMQKHTLGEARWTEVLRDREEGKRVLEYVRSHGGEMPPEPLFSKISRIVMCLPNPYEKYVRVLKASADARDHKGRSHDVRPL